MGKRKRQNASERAARFKRAFDEIIGDPFAIPEPIEGHYSALKHRSTVSIAEPKQKSPSPVNQAKPSAVDFFIDVEAAIADGLEVWNQFPTESSRTIFDDTYFFESGIILTQKERAELEQVIGQIFVYRGISPAAKYFTTIKQ